MITIRPDEGGWERLPDAIGYIRRYKEGTNKTGRKNARLEVQQHSGKQWSFEIWHTKTGYYCQITTRDFISPNDDEEIVDLM